MIPCASPESAWHTTRVTGETPLIRRRLTNDNSHFTPEGSQRVGGCLTIDLIGPTGPLGNHNEVLPQTPSWSSLTGNSTFVATKISRFEVTSVGMPGGGELSTGSAQGFFACGAAVRFDCGQSPRCTAHSQRCTQAGNAGRSRRPRQGCVSVASSTRIRHAGVERPAVGAAATGRWSVRGPGIETPPRAAEASQLRQAG
jgi:hypothetical protein